MTTKDIEQLQTTDSMYASGMVNAYIDGELYRIEITELFKMLKHTELDVVKKRKYNYLILKGGTK